LTKSLEWGDKLPSGMFY